MTDIVLLYDTCCIYEIVALNYFLKFTNSKVVFCSMDGHAVNSMEGYSVNVNMSLSEVNLSDVRSFIVPGGNIKDINNEDVMKILRQLKSNKVLIAAICAGVDVLDNAGILEGIKSTHSTDLDVVNESKVITSRANGYIDFAIEVAKELQLFKDEADLQETINFWKFHKRME